MLVFILLYLQGCLLSEPTLTADALKSSSGVLYKCRSPHVSHYNTTLRGGSEMLLYIPAPKNQSRAVGNRQLCLLL